MLPEASHLGPLNQHVQHRCLGIVPKAAPPIYRLHNLLFITISFALQEVSLPQFCDIGLLVPSLRVTAQNFGF
jgi:hypothetical protein